MDKVDIIIHRHLQILNIIDNLESKIFQIQKGISNASRRGCSAYVDDALPRLLRYNRILTICKMRERKIRKKNYQIV